MVEINFSEILDNGAIIDNRRKYDGKIITLIDILKNLAKGSEGFKCAVGYFYIEGLALLMNELRDLKKIKNHEWVRIIEGEK